MFLFFMLLFTMNIDIILILLLDRFDHFLKTVFTFDHRCQTFFAGYIRLIVENGV